MATYTCKVCQKDNFLSDEMSWTGCYTNKCKNCANIYAREGRLRRKLTGKTKKRLQVKSRYGITESQYYKLVELHLGGCAICKQPCRERILSVDHNHKTGKVRGLLCQRCNRALGFVKEDEDILSGMIEYLKNDGVLTGISY